MQDPVELASILYENIQKGYDIVWAIRERTNIGLFERIFSRLYAKLMKKFVSKSFPYNGFDIVMFNNKVKNMLNQNIEANSSVFIQILMSGFKQGNITYEKQKRRIGKSKWTLSKKVKLFIDSLVAFSYAPIRFVTMVGILFFVFGLIWTSYILIRTLVLNDLSPGWPALISVLLIGFGITNISLGIIAEYLWRTLDASRKRPVFIIDEIIELKKQ
ncbi:putative glycosyltransferase [subsurface metagenome]